MKFLKYFCLFSLICFPPTINWGAGDLSIPPIIHAYNNSLYSPHKITTEPSDQLIVSLDRIYIKDDSDPFGSGEIYILYDHIYISSTRIPTSGTYSISDGEYEDINEIVYDYPSSSSFSLSIEVWDDDFPLSDEMIVYLTNTIIFENKTTRYYGADGDIILTVTAYRTYYAPTIISSPSITTYQEGTTDHWLYWKASDDNPDVYYIYRNGTEISSDYWYSYTNVSQNIDGLDPGTYNFTIKFKDDYALEVTDTVYITVTEGVSEFGNKIITTMLSLIVISAVFYRKKRKNLC